MSDMESKIVGQVNEAGREGVLASGWRSLRTRSLMFSHSRGHRGSRKQKTRCSFASWLRDELAHRCTQENAPKPRCKLAAMLQPMKLDAFTEN